MLAQQPSFWMPPRGSETAGEVDFLFNFVLWISIFFFVLIVGVMLFFVIRYRRRQGRDAVRTSTHNLALELTWTIIPLAIVIAIFAIGFKGFVRMNAPPADAYKISVTGQKWSWEFTYPNGHSDAELHVPVNRDILLTMTSTDVIHSLFIPAFRKKKDVVPGRYTTLWFKAEQPGEYIIFCAEYCGTSHSDMVAQCIVHPTGEFEKWMENADPLKKLTEEQYAAYMADPQKFIDENPDIQGLETPVIMGRKLYAKKGCAQCHSVDGSVGTGPSFKGVYGKEHEMTDGSTIVADDNYLRESILQPNAKVVKGFQAVMPTYQGRLKEREITALIAYIESLKGE